MTTGSRPSPETTAIEHGIDSCVDREQLHNRRDILWDGTSRGLGGAPPHGFHTAALPVSKSSLSFVRQDVLYTGNLASCFDLPDFLDFRNKMAEQILDAMLQGRGRRRTA